MRELIVLSLIFGSLALLPQPSQAARGGNADHVEACQELRGSSRGLFGLCVAFCAQQDLSAVDLNDVTTVRAAAPDIELLRKYNSRRRPADPEMPCLQNNEPPGDEPPGDDDPTGDDDPPGGIPPAAECPCWSGAELASIDGELPPMDDLPSAVECTALDDNGVIFQRQVAEGYDLGFFITAEGVAWASVSSGGGEPYDGCLISTHDGTQRNFPLETTDAEKCMQEIANHCSAIGSP